jgi:hypothetical protein
MKTVKTTKATTATSKVSIVNLIGAYIASLSGLESAKGGVSVNAASLAQGLDALTSNWSEIKWGKSFPNKDAITKEQLAKVASDIETTQSVVKELVLFYFTYTENCKALGIDPSAGFQTLKRASIGYMGDEKRATHPERVAAREAAPKVEKEPKPAVKKEPSVNELPLQEAVTNNPSLAKTALTQIIAGLTTCAKLRKANKVGTDQLKSLIESLQDSLELALAVK